MTHYNDRPPMYTSNGEQSVSPSTDYQPQAKVEDNCSWKRELMNWDHERQTDRERP